jgi:3-methyl-2-oxobutanoate hydroxymethyltransferase
MSSEKISVLTCYDFNTARALEEASIDMILVGDSLAMVGLGYKSTKEVSLEEMIICLKAVRRGAPRTKIVADLPYCSASDDLARMVHDSRKLIEAGADLVKIENAEEKTLEAIKILKALEIDVMGHIGFTPQTIERPSLHCDKQKLLGEAVSLEEVGITSIVLEMIEEGIAEELTSRLSIPTIGIGSGKATTGQVLVTDDLLGRYTLMKPKFVTRLSNQYEDMLRVFKEFKNSF